MNWTCLRSRCCSMRPILLLVVVVAVVQRWKQKTKTSRFFCWVKCVMSVCMCTVLVYFLWFSLLLLLYLITNRPRMLVQISFKIYVYSFLYDSIRPVNCEMLNRAWAIRIVFPLLGHHNKLSILFSFTCKLLPFVFILMALFAFQRRVFCFSVFCFLLQINHRRNNNWFLEWVEWVERVEWGSTEQQQHEHFGPIIQSWQCWAICRQWRNQNHNKNSSFVLLFAKCVRREADALVWKMYFI